MTEDLPLTFDAVWEYLVEARRLVGSRQILADHRFAAGILFERYNDRSIRRLYTPLQETPYIMVRFMHKFHCNYFAPVFVTDVVVDFLIAEQLIEGSPDFSHTERTRWRLSEYGERRVASEWFKDSEITDLFVAGMAMNIRTGETSRSRT